MDLTGKLANLLRKICVTPKKPLVHSASLDQWKSNQDNDWNECAVEIHVIQHRIMAQAAARAYPDKYRLMGAFFNHKSETLQSAEEAGKLFL